MKEKIERSKIIIKTYPLGEGDVLRLEIWNNNQLFYDGKIPKNAKFEVEFNNNFIGSEM